MTRSELLEQIRRKKSVLCVGLDSDIERIPPHLMEMDDPVWEFNKRIIDATHPYTVAYKPNTAFYEARGIEGWQTLQKTVAYIRENYPDIFVIADAKRGDIGNTARMYARAFFEHMHCHAITVAPYMGSDSVQPFLEYEGHWSIVLALTSNHGATDFQFSLLEKSLGSEVPQKLYEKVLSEVRGWGSKENLMFVVGATKADFLSRVRAIVPDHFLLIPGVGSQGGDLQQVMEKGIVNEPAILINSSRSIIFSGSGRKFAQAAADAALNLQKQMAHYL